MITAVQVIVSAISIVWAMKMLWETGARQACDVLEDLRYERLGIGDDKRKIRHQQVPIVSRHLMKVMIGSGIGALFVVVSSISPHFSWLVAGAISGGAIVVLLNEGNMRREKERQKSALDYFLPIVMERIVMAVESGLDILPAIGAVVSIERRAQKSFDPVTDIFSNLCLYTDSGIGFSDALVLIEQQVERPALKHALVHLGLAYREGGEIVPPLRELSDATQLYFQETIEEEIAKMPIKATVPLLCTFAGLIISFLTTPLIQVMMITSQAAPR